MYIVERAIVHLYPDIHRGKFCLSHMFALLLCHTLLQPSHMEIFCLMFELMLAAKKTYF